jgi:hypothetical protein
VPASAARSFLGRNSRAVNQGNEIFKFSNDGTVMMMLESLISFVDEVK